jgi:hypothetical protein
VKNTLARVLSALHKDTLVGLARQERPLVRPAKIIDYGFERELLLVGVRLPFFKGSKCSNLLG